jgi:fatty-acyl-CoA synthase
MLGLMQRHELLVSSIIRFAARQHPRGEVVSRTTEGETHRTDYATIERRARRLARALARLGVGNAERVGTLAWNGFRHLEIYYAVSGMGAVCHTINPRLSDDDLAYIIGHAEDRVLFADTTFAPLLARIAPRIAGTVRAVVFMCDPTHLPDVTLPPGMELLCHETLIEAEGEDFDWPSFDENTAASLCYTSGTTGRPKGVLYSHRSTLLHAYGINLGDVLALRAVDRVLPVVPMFHVNAWGLPYAAPMSGAALVMPGRHLDGASLAAFMAEERVSFTAGVPTVWLGLLAHMEKTGARLPVLKRMMVGGSACPLLLLEAFGAMGIEVVQGWGMTEMSPVGSLNTPTPATADFPLAAKLRLGEKQGRAFFGVEMRIVGDDGAELPWDGKAAGNLMARGPWVCDRYMGDTETRCDAEGWFATGDVGTIDAEGFIEITDRTKDIIKSGGEWISSIALENIAVGHPDVAEAAAIAALHPKWSERPVLIVVPKPDREIDPESVRALFRGGTVPEWWLPDRVIVVDAIPHTGTGKIQKTALRERFGRCLVAAD